MVTETKRSPYPHFSYRELDEELDKIFTRYQTEPIHKILNSARYIVDEDLKWLNPTTPSSGRVTYVDRFGNLCEYSTWNYPKEYVEVYGFNLVEKIRPEFNNKYFHEAHRSNIGIIVGKHGAMWSAYTPDGKILVDECHEMAWLGNKIYAKTGARINEIVSIVPDSEGKFIEINKQKFRFVKDKVNKEFIEKLNKRYELERRYQDLEKQNQNLEKQKNEKLMDKIKKLFKI
jgi:hypothetical protein